MIKLTEKNNIKFIVWSLAIIGIGYIIGINPGISLLIISFLAYLEVSRRHGDIKNCNLLDLTLLFTGIFFIGYFVIKKAEPVYYIPFCTVPMLSVLLFNELKVSLLLTVISALVIASLAGNNLYLGALFLISGVLSIVLVVDARKRSVIIRTGLIIGVIQALTVYAVSGFQIKNAVEYASFFINGVACSIIVIGILPVFEYLFKTTTNISLLELADFNHPLLQRMTLEAPGTYHHSLVVGNLSDAACQAVGANALLARIGAYYHDIGKLSKPDYFSENQNIEPKGNKHDVLTPTMSKLVIMNHVKEGVELAKKYKFNARLIDFIQAHHGNSLVYYFYRRAIENSEENEQVQEDGFRYPGPKPKTREVAIVLLADSVEAASRTVRDPSPANIEEVVHKVINNKFIDGQLDECDLTLKEMEKIAAVFIRILSGIYHSRVNYPEAKT
jgi:putative nucleotidyltransferase with HDIG domain